MFYQISIGLLVIILVVHGQSLSKQFLAVFRVFTVVNTMGQVVKYLSIGLHSLFLFFDLGHQSISSDPCVHFVVEFHA